MKACTHEIEYKIYTVETRALCSCQAWQSPPPYIGRCAEVKALAQRCSECHGCSLPWDLSQKVAFCSRVTSSEVKSWYTATHHFYLCFPHFVYLASQLPKWQEQSCLWITIYYGKLLSSHIKPKGRAPVGLCWHKMKLQRTRSASP